MPSAARAAGPRRPVRRPPPGRRARRRRRSPSCSEPARPLKLDLAARAGAASTTAIHLSRVQRPGLALTGYTDYIRYGRVQIIGSSEIGLPAQARGRAAGEAILDKLCRCRITCFVVTKGLVPPTELLAAAEARGIPVLTTPLESTAVHQAALRVPRGAARHPAAPALGAPRRLRPRRPHPWARAGSASRSARSTSSTAATGWSPTTSSRSSGWATCSSAPRPTSRATTWSCAASGVLNIKDLYGVSSIRLSQAGRARRAARALGGGQGVRPPRPARRDVPRSSASRCRSSRMPVAPGRNIALLVEVAARNQLLREGGYDAAKRFVERVDEHGGRRARRRAAGARARPGEEARERGARQRPQAARHHGPVGLGQDARLARPRGRRLVLRRQPADRPRALVRRSHPRLRAAAPLGPRGGRARARVPEAFPAVYRAAEGRATSRRACSSSRRTRRCCCAASARPAGRTRWPGTQPAIEGIRAEREALRPIRKMADVILDTSRFTVHELRDYVRERYDVRARGAAHGGVRRLVRLQVRAAAGGGPRLRRALPRRTRTSCPRCAA